LRTAAGAIDEEMGRHSNFEQLIEERVLPWGKSIREEPLDLITSVAARRQADVVHDDEGDAGSCRPRVKIRRVDPAHSGKPAVVTPLDGHLTGHARMRVT
jgi:hypothetical protein